MIDGLKPYPAMKDSDVPWLGEVPEHWEVRRLKHGFQRIVGGSTPSSAEATYWDGAVVWVTPADVSKASRLKGSQRRITSDGLSACSAELVPPGSIIVTSRAPVGNVAIADVELCTNQGCKALVPALGQIDPMFGLHVLSTLKGELQSLATGTTFTEISTSRIGDVRVPLPPLPEQAAIVRFLDHADRRIRRYIHAKQKLIKLLEEQKQAIIHRAVTRGLDPNVRLKPSGVEWLGDVPEHWEVSRGKYYFREVDVRSATGREELLSVSHISGVTPRSQKNITMFKAESYVGSKICKPGQIAVNTMWAWMAAIGVSNYHGLVSPSYHTYEQLDAARFADEYLDLLVRTKMYKDFYTVNSSGITTSRLRLYPEDFLNIRFLRPPRREQEAILEWLHDATVAIEAAIGRADQEISLLREYRTRLIADVVTGKLDVREAAAGLPDEAEEPEPLYEAGALADAEDAMADDLDTELQEAEA